MIAIATRTRPNPMRLRGGAPGVLHGADARRASPMPRAGFGLPRFLGASALFLLVLALAAAPAFPAAAQNVAGPSIAGRDATSPDAGSAENTAPDGHGESAAISPALSPREKAEGIERLIAGNLDARITAASLLGWTLRYDDVLRAGIVERLVNDDAFYEKAKADAGVLAPLGLQEARLALAQARFRRLPEARRMQLLRLQAERNARQSEEASRRSAAERTLQQLNAQAASLDAFLKGEPDPAGISPLFWVGGGEGAALAGQDFGDSTQAVREARQRRDDLLAQVLALPGQDLRELADRRRLTQSSGREIARADQALQQATSARREAQEAARTAASASARLIAAESDRLLAVKQRQAVRRREIARSSDDPGQILDAALDWQRRVPVARSAGLSQVERFQRADQLYWQLVKELGTVRRRLSGELAKDPAAGFADARPGPLNPAIADSVAGARRLRALYDEVTRESERLTNLRAEQIWNQRKALEQAMVTLNDTRLAVIPELSPSLRRQVVGFGPEGAAQVGRELDQIALVLRYNLQSYRIQLHDLLATLLGPSPAFVMSLFMLAVAIVLFRLWRRRGDMLLIRMERKAGTRRPATLRSTIEFRAVHYFRKVKRPFDWFLFIQILRRMIPEELALPGLELAWILLTWVLGAITLLRLVDALAGGARANDPRAALRWRSLRLAGGAVVLVGMVLRITAASVGRGAIYSWVLSGCWLLIVPVLLVLSNWWRERIVALAGMAAGQSALLGWIAKDPGGFFGTLGRLVAGGLLLAQGFVAVVSHRIRSISLIRDIYSQRSRQEAARKAAEDLASGNYRRIDDAAAAILAPHRQMSESEAQIAVPVDREVRCPVPGTVTAVIGDRGRGKSRVLALMRARAAPPTRTVAVVADRHGLDGLVAAIHAALDGASGNTPTRENLVAALAGSSDPVLIAIDDVQRLLTPAIGGLAQFDALVALTRGTPPHVTWVLGIGRPAWDFLSRARADRRIFDSVYHLPRWNADALRHLLEARSREAGIDPDFSEIREEAAFLLDSDLPAAERRKRGYYARLRDYSGGNPAVALEFWRRSLFVEIATGRHVVRTFATPDVARLTVLPDATLFVLRTIIVMDQSSDEAIAASTDLPQVVIADALRGLQAAAIISTRENGYRVDLGWWREVIDLLARRNLIMAEEKA